MTRRLLLLLCVLALSGCAGVGMGVNINEYVTEKPKLDLREYFSGTIDGWGQFQDRSGKVVKRFTVRIEAQWIGDEGTLDEHFVYADGTRENRVWRLTKAGDRYTGSAGDVVGTATGVAAGNALRWNYVLALPVDGRTWNMDMDDWMYLMDERTMLNRTTMSKFGVEVGQVTLAFRKR